MLAHHWYPGGCGSWPAGVVTDAENEQVIVTFDQELSGSPTLAFEFTYPLRTDMDGFYRSQYYGEEGGGAGGVQLAVPGVNGWRLLQPVPCCEGRAAAGGVCNGEEQACMRGAQPNAKSDPGMLLGLCRHGGHAACDGIHTV